MYLEGVIICLFPPPLFFLSFILISYSELLLPLPFPVYIYRLFS